MSESDPFPVPGGRSGRLEAHWEPNANFAACNNNLTNVTDRALLQSTNS